MIHKHLVNYVLHLPHQTSLKVHYGISLICQLLIYYWNENLHGKRLLLEVWLAQVHITDIPTLSVASIFYILIYMYVYQSGIL